MIIRSDNTSWNTNAEFWDNAMGNDLNDYHRQVVRPAVMELLGNISGESVLDIASGNGSFSALLSRMGANVTAIDYSDRLIDIAKKRWKESNVEFLVCDATDEESILSLGERRFTKAVSTMALMDISNIEPMVKALSKVLKHNGIFVFATQHPCFVTLTDRYMTEHSYQGEAIAGQPVQHTYYHRSLQDLFSPIFENGFVIEGLKETCFKDKEHPDVLTVKAILIQ